MCKNTEPVLFADDTKLFSSGSNAISLQDGVNNDLPIITEWLKVNKLSLNIKKTHFMCFSANKANLRDLKAATGLVISNWIQIVNFQTVWPWNLMDDLEKQ